MEGPDVAQNVGAFCVSEQPWYFRVMTGAGNRVVISEMKGWDFWSDPHALGLLPEIADALADGTATEAQKQLALAAGRLAFEQLVKMPVNVARS